MSPLSILLATDGSAEAGTAVAFLQALPLPYLTTVHVLSAVQAPATVGEVPVSDAVQELVRFERAACEEAVRTATDALSRDGLLVLSLIPEARVAEAILGAVEEYGIDLIVLGAKERGALAEVLLESLTPTLVRRSPVPVLVTRPLRHGLRSVVLASSGSPASQGAARFLSRLPLPEGCQVTLAHVLTPESTQDGQEWIPPNLAALGSDGGLLPAQDSSPNTPVRLEQRIGDPAKEMVRLAQDVGADLLVAGAPQISWAKALLDGNVADRLAREAHCSVLLVPDGGA